MCEKYTMKNVKNAFMNGLVSDMRLLNMFGKDEAIKKNTDYKDRNIFDYFCNSSKHGDRCDSFVEFDVQNSYDENHFDLVVFVKTHQDMVRMNSGENRADAMSIIVQEIAKEVFPDLHFTKNVPCGCDRNYVYRRIVFNL